jgi:hypothetical protein
MNRKGVDQLTVNETQADLEDGQIAAILAVDQVSTPLVNGAGTDDQ